MNNKNILALINKSHDIVPIEQYYCTRCGSWLDKQPGFNPNESTWTCTICGQFLFGDVYAGEEYPNVMWFCDGCRTLLNQQPGFSDINIKWTCLKCGYKNKLDTIIIG